MFMGWRIEFLLIDNHFLGYSHQARAMGPGHSQADSVVQTVYKCLLCRGMQRNGEKQRKTVVLSGTDILV